MNPPWDVIAAIVILILALLAELNLMRIFLSDWIKGQRERTALPHRHNTIRRTSLEIAAVIAIAWLAPHAHGQDAPPKDAQAKPAAEAVAAQEKSPYTLTLNLDFTSAYIYHGFVQEDTGLIVQPGAKATVSLYAKDDVSFDLLLGQWNSIQSRKTGAAKPDDTIAYWYEADFTAGFEVTLGKWTLTPTYTFFTSPNGAFETQQEFDLNIAYDDSDLLKEWAMHPYALFAFETSANAGDGQDPGTYLELGIAPGFSFKASNTPISITFPAAVGLSLHEYFQNASGKDQTFGYAQVGVKGSVPLPFAERYGKWSLSAGLSVYYLASHLAELNNNDPEKVVGTMGIQLEF